jgi:sigma-70-like protein
MASVDCGYSSEGRLTAQGQSMLTDWLKQWPKPELLIHKRHREVLRSAKERFGEDDVRAWSIFAAVNAAVVYKPDMGEFGPLARQCILRQVLNLLRKPPVPSPVEDIELSDDTSAKLADACDACTDASLILDSHDDRGVLRDRYGIGTTPKTLEQIGRRLKVTKSRVQQIEMQTFQQLAAHYGV